MRVAVLGSGSGGNATLVEADGFRLLIDAGFSGRSTERRLRAVGVDASSLSAIVVTHDHGDHTRGMGILARRFGLPLHLTPTTREACAELLRGGEEICHYHAARPFRIGPFEVSPFLTAHDAADPVAITLRHARSGHKLGLATDLGRPTAGVRHALAGCHLLVLEANHDEVMLWDGPYPLTTKRRIASSHGHLSNRAAAKLARALHHHELACVILAHLSENCNKPQLAREVVGRALRGEGYEGPLRVAAQDGPLEPVDVAAMRRRMGPEQLALL